MKMITVIMFTGVDTELLSTYTRTKNDTIIAMYGMPCTSALLKALGMRRAGGAPRRCSRAAAASQT